jgi:hypothetical protein
MCHSRVLSYVHDHCFAKKCPPATITLMKHTNGGFTQYNRCPTHNPYTLNHRKDTQKYHVSAFFCVKRYNPRDIPISSG